MMRLFSTPLLLTALLHQGSPACAPSALPANATQLNLNKVQRVRKSARSHAEDPDVTSTSVHDGSICESAGESAGAAKKGEAEVSEAQKMTPKKAIKEKKKKKEGPKIEKISLIKLGGAEVKMGIDFQDSLIVNVHPKSWAEMNGIQRGDVLSRVDGKPFGDLPTEEFVAKVTSKYVTIEVLRIDSDFQVVFRSDSTHSNFSKAFSLDKKSGIFTRVDQYAAHRYGIQIGDKLVSVNGKLFSKMSDTEFERIANAAETEKKKVVLGYNKASKADKERVQQNAAIHKKLHEQKRSSFKLTKVDKEGEAKKKLGFGFEEENGDLKVKYTRPDSWAVEQDLRAGDVIETVNGFQVNKLDDDGFMTELKKDRVVLEISRIEPFKFQLKKTADEKDVKFGMKFVDSTITAVLPERFAESSGIRTSDHIQSVNGILYDDLKTTQDEKN